MENEIKAKVFAQYLGQIIYASYLKMEHYELTVVSEQHIHYLDKLVLKPLSDITDEDAKEFIKILFNDVEDKISSEEIDIDIHLGDGGNMVDGDMILVIEIICRCFEGQLAIRECGSLLLYDEEGELQPLRNTLSGMQYLQSKGYDLPNYLLGGKTLQESGLAIYNN